ncbi:hypothetical protein HanHA300_Chr15g0564941 [Helianthus annuus]|nr:hypothetical protein HanHA300_Chr15g0564941 [Helianthus annuus]KAJ0455636.1 hypothetical protein HanIR_Chr15g0753441 [Helianthus annuus]KAJ0473070.1 hypothetical protein HanHA89_Chr15g0614181 [Helianthus annuus]KAJ0648672.1 hypothetical protein HanLR1_Chr15g0575541 [Helianthus annuus]KAJ0652487.1 hypothetical protein HanOQP8_Chr15g0572711 [Helianthus annuus]
MLSLFTIHPSIIFGSFHSISTVSSLINKDKVESVVSSFFSVRRTSQENWDLIVKRSLNNSALNHSEVVKQPRSVAGHAARNFVEHGMTDEKLCNVSEEAYAPY